MVRSDLQTLQYEVRKDGIWVKVPGGVDVWHGPFETRDKAREALFVHEETTSIQEAS